MAIVDELSALRTSTLAAIEQAADTSALEEVRVAVLGKSGTLTGYLRSMGQVPAEERASVGRAVNAARVDVEEALAARKAALDAAELEAAMGAAGQVVNGFLALAASVYLLCGKAELLHTARLALRTALPPRTAGNVLGVFAMANKTFSGYIGGQLVDAVLVGGETFVLMLLFGIPYAPLISVVVAVTNIVPMLGPYLGAVPGAALLLFSGQPVHALEFLVIVLVVQQVDGNFIAPRILGSATGISGLWVLAAIVVGGGLFGIPGMVIGVPVLGVAANLAKAALPREPDGEKTKPGGET